MIKNTGLGVATCLAALTGLFGCAPDDSDYDDVAAAVGALVSNEDGGEVGSMEDCGRIATGEVPEGLTRDGSGSYSGLRGGLTYEYGVTCADASGAVLEVCDGTTDSARYAVSWAGEIDLPGLGYWASIARTGDWTLSGIQSGESHLDGFGTFDVETEFHALYRPVSRHFLLDYDAAYDDVRIGPAGFVRGGEITYQVHAEGEREGRYGSSELDLDVEVVVTFDGTGGAEIVLDGDRTYDLDLETGTIEPRG